MFTPTWRKYLPVITILLKRSVNGGDQTLSMNHTDFERAAGGRKIKFNFTNLHLTNGRINNNAKHTPLAKEFATLLQEDEQTRKLIKKQQFEFTMTNGFQLHIKNTTPPAEPETQISETEDAAAS